MLDGDYARLSDFNTDGPMIINFWTTWWTFCERQLAYLDQLNKHFSKVGLKVLAVNANKPNILNQVRPYINKRKYKFPVSVDPRGKLAKTFRVVGYPSLFFVDHNGRIFHKSSGYEDGEEHEYLKRLLEYYKKNKIIHEEFKFQKQVTGTETSKVIIDF